MLSLKTANRDVSFSYSIFNCFAIFQNIPESLSFVNTLVILTDFITVDCR